MGVEILITAIASSGIFGVIITFIIHRQKDRSEKKQLREYQQLKDASELALKSVDSFVKANEELTKQVENLRIENKRQRRQIKDLEAQLKELHRSISEYMEKEGEFNEKPNI